MIYVIESYEYFKVGFTKNWETRKGAYNTHCPKWSLVFLWEGCMGLESHFHNELAGEEKPSFEWFEKFDGWEKNLQNIYESYLELGLPIKPEPEKTPYFNKQEREVLWALSLLPTNSDGFIIEECGTPMYALDLRSHFRKLDVKFSYTTLMRMHTKYRHEKYFRMEFTKMITPKHFNGIFTVRILKDFKKITENIYG